MSATRTGDAVGSERVFRHEALLYEGQPDFLRGTLPFIRDGLAGDEAVLVVVDASKISALRAALGNDADRVQFADMAAVGRNPARIIPRWQQFLTEHLRTDRPVRGIGEPIWAGRTPAELVECQAHETLLNLAFAQTPGWTLLCPYDICALDDAVVGEARRSHPVVVHDGVRHASPEFLEAHPSPARLDQPLPAAPTDAHTIEFRSGADALTTVRHFVTLQAERAGLNSTATAKLVLALNELATNSLIHGGGHGTIRLWRDNSGLICEVRDAGRLNGNPLLGRQVPAAHQIGGRGIWLANQLCDLTQIRSTATGTVIRIHMATGSPG
jgi:anti-sigma regulatory factor (Ser/Thr protein kinase)